MTRKRPHKGRTRRGQGRRAVKQKQLLEGKLVVMRPGIAEVRTSEGIFRVAARGLREGMHGDEVQVSLVDTHKGDKLAYVQMVLSRATTTILGRFEQAGPLGAVIPLDTRITSDFFVLPEDNNAHKLGVETGDIVLARILEYPTRISAAVVTLERRVGSPEDLDINIESAIASYGLPTIFSDAALEEADVLTLDVESALLDPLRRDVRDELCITIDPVDARDYDDAVGARRLANGGYELFVHIADVSHYVRWNSSIDNEAKQRTCSVYLADRVIPMLPERLSNDLCSLKPQEDRLAMSVKMTLDNCGKTLSAQLFPSVIRSRARLSYDEVDAFLEGNDNTIQRDIQELLVTLNEIRSLREAIRVNRGSVDFTTVESRVVLDEKGVPTGVHVRKRTDATGLIEEAMLAANESVAIALAHADIASAYRVHERPSPDHLKSCVLPLREMDVLDANEVNSLVAGDPSTIQHVLKRAQDRPAAYLASALMLRAQKRAVYSPHNEGHYALGANAYCHFTSPIRRYPDLIVHRSLKALLASALDTDEQRNITKALSQLCTTCSEQERVADAAARTTQKIKMAEYYSTHVGEVFSGIVSGCERYGLFITLDDTYAEGLIPIQDLGDEWFIYDEDRMTLTGENTGRVWGLGKRVGVCVAQTNIPRGQIDFALVT